MYTEAVLYAPQLQAAKEYDLIIDLSHRNVEIAYPWEAVLHLIQLVVMGGKESLGTSTLRVVYILRHGPGDRDAIVGARPSPDFVKQNQTTG